MFTAKLTLYSTDEYKVAYASSWLTGAAARTWENWVERKMDDIIYNPALHEWEAFLREFGRLFGVHNEQLHAQAALDKAIQQPTEPFADFLVRFEDASLKTKFNDHALRWALLKHIRKDLRNRLTNNGMVPQSYTELVDWLLDIDGAQEAFTDAGLLDPYVPRVPVVPVVPVQPIPVSAPRALPRGRNAIPQNNKAQGNAAQAQETRQPKIICISKPERDRRFANNLCLGCGEPGHFAQDCPNEEEGQKETEPAVGRAAFSIEDSEEESALMMIDSYGTLFKLKEDDNEGNENRAQEEEEGDN
ncbi:hypothetical protein D9758_005248 [Tetrapyrgos nigripes]|uniref:CCHC-type domain-containing protein n=1 Tax=Tetrapyrgos nigripes TaxID=182062 RepID=A0A8H5LWZ7_9AGAR|nr:hypothetical protein D9758_005248 [Tetrapyrgos nigripes]